MTEKPEYETIEEIDEPLPPLTPENGVWGVTEQTCTV
jgi:hypothetical protein